MRILIPTWGLHARFGGIRVLCELASGLVRRGHRVLFLTFDGEGPTAFPTLAEHEEIGRSPGGRNLIRELPRQEMMRRAIERHPEAEVVLANHHLTARPVHRSRVPGRKFYYVQAYEPDCFPHRLHHEPPRWLAKRSYTYPLGLIANCPMVARQCAGSLGSQVPIVPPGIDPALYHARDRRPAGPRLVVGTISRTEFWKGSADCFEAVRRVRALGFEVDFRVAFGNIPAGHEGEPRLDDAPADDRQLAGWYRGLDVLVAGVHDGGAPYPPIEAMACGTAVVTTPNEHVTDGRNALTAPQEDAVALAAALARMLEDRALRERLVLQGLEDVQGYHWENVVKKMEDVFTGAVSAPTGRPR